MKVICYEIITIKKLLSSPEYFIWFREDYWLNSFFHSLFNNNNISLRGCDSIGISCLPPAIWHVEVPPCQHIHHSGIQFRVRFPPVTSHFENDSREVGISETRTETEAVFGKNLSPNWSHFLFFGPLEKGPSVFFFSSLRSSLEESEKVNEGLSCCETDDRGAEPRSAPCDPEHFSTESV